MIKPMCMILKIYFLMDMIIGCGQKMKKKSTHKEESEDLPPPCRL